MLLLINKALQSIVLKCAQIRPAYKKLILFREIATVATYRIAREKFGEFTLVKHLAKQINRSANR